MESKTVWNALDASPEIAWESPLEKGVFHYPAGSVDKKPPKFEYQASSKTAYRDTFTKKKYFISQFGNWLNENHVQEKFNQGFSCK